jgi:hypothetical protein
MGDFDLTTFWSGDYFSGEIPDSIAIDLDKGNPSDLLGNPMSWLIMSIRLRNKIQALCGEYVQFIPLTMLRDNKPVNRYVLANPLGTVDAIVARKAKEEIPIQRLVLDASKIPSDRHLFRLQCQETTFIISQDMFDLLYHKGYHGLAARQVTMK